jgi:signal transduction histidine kinase
MQGLWRRADDGRVDTFDESLARLDEAFAGQRRFIADASHELRTPLTAMRTTLDVVLAKPAATTAELIAMGNDVQRSVHAAEGLIESLLTLARNERGRTVDLAFAGGGGGLDVTVRFPAVHTYQPGDEHSPMSVR